MTSMNEKPIVDILKFNLEKEGFSTAVAYDGEDAINLALSIKPDLILLDLMLLSFLKIFLKSER